MGMEAIEFVYYVCFFLGFGFAVLSALLSGVFSGGAEAHVDVSHAHGGDGPVHFPILSPVTLAMFVATFGGAGIVFKKFLHLPMAAHIPLAAIAAVVVALLVAWLFYKLFSMTSRRARAKPPRWSGWKRKSRCPSPTWAWGRSPTRCASAG